MENTYLKGYLNDGRFKNFESVAMEFCSYLENLAGVDKISFVVRIRDLLANLYASAIRLPGVELVIDSDYENPELRNKIVDKAREIGSAISGILGEIQFYKTAFLPTDMNEKVLSDGFLDDDLRDIYLDIKDAFELINLNTEESVQQGLWDIVFSLRSHWGEHCVSALHYLHYVS